MKHASIFAIAFLATAAHATPPEKAPTAIAGAKGGSAKVVNKITITPTFGAPVASASLSAAKEPAASSAPGAPALGAQTLIGGTVYERSAPASNAPAGSAPVTSCRLFFGLAGSQTGGSLGAGLPMGNDQVCITHAQFALMDKLGGFEAADYLRAACKVEGMSETSRCKAMAKEPALSRDVNLLP